MKPAQRAASGADRNVRALLCFTAFWGASPDLVSQVRDSCIASISLRQQVHQRHVAARFHRLQRITSGRPGSHSEATKGRSMGGIKQAFGKIVEVGVIRDGGKGILGIPHRQHSERRVVTEMPIRPTRNTSNYLEYFASKGRGVARGPIDAPEGLGQVFAGVGKQREPLGSASLDQME